jgi:5-methylcytosine-specific restriction endonuclease McrA
MKIEYVILGVTTFFIVNAYHDGKYMVILKSWKKYYQMGFYAFLGLSLYLFMKRHPGQSHSLLKHATGIIKYMPVDKNAKDFLTPIFSLSGHSLEGSPHENSRITTSGNNQYGGAGGSGAWQGATNTSTNTSTNTVGASTSANTVGVKAGTTKRSVSETKKKYVASRQNWKCGDCNEQLTAWFEVHHKQALEHGGSNHIDNLVALCRNCHGAHTALDNL